MSTPPTTEPRIRRRALMRGAAWASPVVAVATAAPAYAKSGAQPRYDLSTSWSSMYSYTWDNYGNCCATQLRYSNMVNNRNTAAYGFSVFNRRMVIDGTETTDLSPTVDPTATNVTTILYYPFGMVNTSAQNNGVTIDSRDAPYWRLTDLRAVTLSDGRRYSAFTFSWRGTATQKTVTANEGQRVPSWATTSLRVHFSPSNRYCPGSSVTWWVAHTGTFTTTNGWSATVTANPQRQVMKLGSW
ncbi:hypothetical protein MHY20_00290 [Helcobacillus sp. ACRRO]|uniref:hypothetical protein n=1 Tax=Helcobacillus TaxID=1161125 RepID=UPI001EF71B34|nr:MULTISPECIES: hypothetical protein [Helcobacillus]MCG7426070.1 hypothetical protein [Helcobacillus sp. ACRRO]MCT2036866.1 hypothetical protein [Helcobacillus massiliensis]